MRLIMKTQFFTKYPKMRTEQITITIPRTKKGLKKELRRLKDEDAVNISALFVNSIEEKLGIFSYK